MCGSLDGNADNDIVTKTGRKTMNIVNAVASWQVDNIGGKFTFWSKSMVYDTFSFTAHCSSAPMEKRECPGIGVKGSLGSEAKSFCIELLSNSQFSSCSKVSSKLVPLIVLVNSMYYLQVLDRTLLMDACTWDYCNCESEDKSDCACDTMNIYVSECKFEGLTTVSNWRNEEICRKLILTWIVIHNEIYTVSLWMYVWRIFYSAMKCTGGRVYKACGPSKGHPVCGASKTNVVEDSKTCEEGCFCPEGKVLHNGECIDEIDCPCRLRKKEFPAGSSVPKDCNTCTCQKGHWVCTQVWLWMLMEEKVYDSFVVGFLWRSMFCSWWSSLYNIRWEEIRFYGTMFLLSAWNCWFLSWNWKCCLPRSNFRGILWISFFIYWLLIILLSFNSDVFKIFPFFQLLGFTKSSTTELPSCTKTATIKVNGSLSIKLGQNHQVSVNGQDVSKLPLENAGIKIRIVSSIFIQGEERQSY